MSTTVIEKAYASSHGAYETIVADVTDLWNWTDIEELTNGTVFWIDENKTFGIYVYNGNANYTSIGIMFGSNGYHYAGSGTSNKLIFKAEKIGTKALIISAWRVSNSDSPVVSANLCDKYIICDAVSTATNEEEKVLVYLGSSSTSGANKCMMLASDVTLPADITVQNANANVNAINTNMIPFYSTASAFITTDTYQSLCENVSSWYFGNVIVNDDAYRMSGSVFVLDE